MPASPAPPAPSPGESDATARAWAQAMEPLRDAWRAQGHGVFLPAGGGSAAGDRWIDADAPVERWLAEAVGHRVLAGASVDVAAWQRAAAAWREGQQAELARWTTQPRAVPERALLPLSRIPDALRPAVTLAVSADEPAIPCPLVDTGELPEDLAQAVLASLPTPDIRLLRGDNRAALRVLLAEGAVLDAVIEDPPYDTGGKHLGYRDQWPPGAWRAVLREHLGLVRRALSPHGLAVLHIDEHRGADLHQLTREVFGDGHLGTTVWDKRNPKGDATGVGVQHERMEWATPSRSALRLYGGLTRTKPDGQRMLDEAARLVAQHGGVHEATRAAWARWVAAEPGLSGGARAYRLLSDEGRVYRKVSLAWPNKQRAPDSYFTPVRHPVTQQLCPVPRRGWRCPPDTMARLIANGTVTFGPDHTSQPTRRTFLADTLRESVPSVLPFAGSDDARLAHMGVRFPFAKPVDWLLGLIDMAAHSPDAHVFDGFGGSGSLAHAVLDANDRDQGRRRVTLAEADDTVFDTCLLPRVVRAVRSDRWRDGQPVGASRSVVIRIDRVVL